MCGIFGVVNGASYSAPSLGKFFADAMLAGQVRGTDGAGVFTANSKGRVKIAKSSSCGSLWGRMVDGSADVMEQVGKDFLTVGHHRAATIGEVSDDNTHPFWYFHEGTKVTPQGVVGVHNGTLRLKGAVNHAESENYEVDSQYLIAELSRSSNYVETLTYMPGAIATVFYAPDCPDKFYMFTNGQRPLHFAFTDTVGPGMLIASEAEMLYWLAKRNNISLRKNEVLECRDNVLYTFDREDLLNYSTEEEEYTNHSSWYSPYKERSDFSWGGGLRETVKNVVKELLNTVSGGAVSVQNTETGVGSKDPTDRSGSLGVVGLVYRQEVDFTPLSFTEYKVNGSGRGKIVGVVTYQDATGEWQIQDACIHGATRELFNSTTGRDCTARAGRLGWFTDNGTTSSVLMCHDLAVLEQCQSVA